MLGISLANINLINFMDAGLKHRYQAGLVLKNKSKTSKVYFWYRVFGHLFLQIRQAPWPVVIFWRPRALYRALQNSASPSPGQNTIYPHHLLVSSGP